MAAVEATIRRGEEQVPDTVKGDDPAIDIGLPELAILELKYDEDWPRYLVPETGPVPGANQRCRHRAGSRQRHAAGGARAPKPRTPRTAGAVLRRMGPATKRPRGLRRLPHHDAHGAKGVDSPDLDGRGADQRSDATSVRTGVGSGAAGARTRPGSAATAARGVLGSIGAHGRTSRSAPHRPPALRTTRTRSRVRPTRRSCVQRRIPGTSRPRHPQTRPRVADHRSVRVSLSS